MRRLFATAVSVFVRAPLPIEVGHVLSWGETERSRAPIERLRGER